MTAEDEEGVGQEAMIAKEEKVVEMSSKYGVSL